MSPQCPVYDLDNNVAFIGMYQTMTKKAAITVQVSVGLCQPLPGAGGTSPEPPKARLRSPPSGMAVAEEGFPQQQFLRGGGGEDGGRGVRGGTALLPLLRRCLTRYAGGGTHCERIPAATSWVLSPQPVPSSR